MTEFEDYKQALQKHLDELTPGNFWKRKEYMQNCIDRMESTFPNNIPKELKKYPDDHNN